jgi:hypothetical protein
MSLGSAEFLGSVTMRTPPWSEHTMAKENLVDKMASLSLLAYILDRKYICN